MKINENIGVLESSLKTPQITPWVQEKIHTDKSWESAYKIFETPSQEIVKFKIRLKRLGADNWSRKARIVELFCGRGNGLKALEELGFKFLEGVDLSLSLLREYSGIGSLYVGDCRDLRFQAGSKDFVIVQGGLHHLPSLPEDLEKVFLMIKRILLANGRFVFVEPWQTPFLSLVHGACSSVILTSLWPKLEALSNMIEGEKKTYFNWLANKALIISLLKKYFIQEIFKIGFGKIMYVGRIS